MTMSSREGLSSFDPESDRETSTEATNLLDASRSQVYYDSDGETKVNFSTRPNIAFFCIYGCVIKGSIGVVCKDHCGMRDWLAFGA